LFLGALSADAQVTNGRGTFDAVLAGRRGTPFQLQLNGQFAPERIAVAARGEYAGRDIAMPRRAVFTKTDDGGWNLARTQISFGGGTMLVDGRMGGTEPPEGRLQLAEMPLSLIDAAGFEYGLGGTISGIVEMGAAEGGQAIGEARVMVDGLTRSGLVLTSRPVNLALVADLSPTLLQVRAALRENGQQYGRVQMRIAELPQSGGLFDRLQAGAMLAQLRYKGPASALWRLAALEAFDITGELSVAANARGTLRNPVVRGSLGGDSLRVQSALTGTNI
jgi:translocation and assembly module TamB